MQRALLEKLLGRKETFASKYRAAKAGHISAKGIGGGWFGEFAGLEPPTIGWFAPQKSRAAKAGHKVQRAIGGLNRKNSYYIFDASS